MKQSRPRDGGRHLCIMALMFISLLSGCGAGADRLVEGTQNIPTEAEEAIATTPVSVDSASAIPAASETIAHDQTNTPVVWVDAATPTLLDASITPYTTFTVTPFPTNSAVPTLGPTARFTRTSTPTPTVTATFTPRDAVLHISRPGLFSKIVSPYKIEAAVIRGEDGYVYLSLVGEDQEIIASEMLDFRRSLYERLIISPTLEFSIPTVGATARLILQTHDLQGRIMALSSVDLILLSIGKNEITPPQRLYESLIIDDPSDGDIQTGRLLVSGRAAALNDTPVIIELLDESGAVLAARQLQLDMPAGERVYSPFTVELEYSVSRETHARLSIRQESDPAASRLPGTIALTSVAVTLLP